MGCPGRPSLPSLGDRRGPCPRRSPATADATPTMQTRLIFGWRMRRAAVGGTDLSPGEPLFEAVACLLRKRWSPEQIAGRRKRMEGGVESSSGLSVSHETIY